MHTSMINFCGRMERLYGQGETKKERYRDLDKELKAAYTARSAGVSSAPVYMAMMMPPKGGELGVKYEIEGKPANAKTNPITPKHIENLLQNFFLMDKAGLCHRNLSIPNIYYSEGGKVEFTSMKDMVKFQLIDGHFTYKNRDLLDFAMPSNAKSFENSSLSRYLHNIKDDDAKCAFIGEYLTQRSEYNEFRARHLEKMGLKSTDDAILYETAQSLAFKEPSNEVVEHFKDKLEIIRTKNNATIMWHKSGGYFDGVANPIERFASVILMLETLKNAAQLRDRADELSQSAKTPTERQYFAFEKEVLNIWVENIHEEVKNGAEDNFCNKGFAGNKGLYLGCAEDKKVFDEFFGEININDNSKTTSGHIDTVITYYTNLVKDWTPENNREYKMQYLKNGVRA